MPKQTWTALTSGKVANYVAGHSTAGVVIDPSNGTIKVPTAGNYRVTIQGTFLPYSTSGKELAALVYVNGSPSNEVAFHQVTSKDYKTSAYASGILTLNANDLLSVYLWKEYNVENMYFIFFDFRIERLD